VVALVAVVAVAAFPPMFNAVAVPVKLVATPEAGVPKPPPFTKTDPAVPVLTARAVATPVPSPLTPVLMGSPVKLVAIPEAGVPNAGAVRIGEVKVLLVKV
jgi:hypothetical protein